MRWSNGKHRVHTAFEGGDAGGDHERRSAAAGRVELPHAAEHGASKGASRRTRRTATIRRSTCIRNCAVSGSDLSEASGAFTGPVPQAAAAEGRALADRAGGGAGRSASGGRGGVRILFRAERPRSGGHPLHSRSPPDPSGRIGRHGRRKAAWWPITPWWTGRAQIFTRSLQSPAAVQVTHCPANCDRPTWSADGRQIYLRSAKRRVGGGRGGRRSQTGSAGRRGVRDFSRRQHAGIYPPQQQPDGHFGVDILASRGATPKHYQPAPYEGVDTGTGLRLLFARDGHSIRVVGTLLRARFGILDAAVPGRSPANRGAFWNRCRMPSRCAASTGWPADDRLILAAALPPSVYRSHLYLADLDGGP